MPTETGSSCPHKAAEFNVKQTRLCDDADDGTETRAGHFIR